FYYTPKRLKNQRKGRYFGREKAVSQRNSRAVSNKKSLPVGRLFCCLVWRSGFDEAHEHGGGLRAGGGALGGQDAVAHAGQDALAERPGHGVGGVVADGSAVSELAYRHAAGHGAARVAVEHRHHLLAGD